MNMERSEAVIARSTVPFRVHGRELETLDRLIHRNKRGHDLIQNDDRRKNPTIFFLKRITLRFRKQRTQIMHPRFRFARPIARAIYLNTLLVIQERGQHAGVMFFPITEIFRDKTVGIRHAKNASIHGNSCSLGVRDEMVLSLKTTSCRVESQGAEREAFGQGLLQCRRHYAVTGSPPFGAPLDFSAGFPSGFAVPRSRARSDSFFGRYTGHTPFRICVSASFGRLRT